MRKYIRHPADIPLSCRLQEDEDHTQCCAHNISMGGLCFDHDTYIKPKSIVHININISDPEFETNAIVIWCNKVAGAYELGIKFENDATEFSMRMVEQLCHIEHYKNEVLIKEGRQLSSDEAASEWIKKHAKSFPL